MSQASLLHSFKNSLLLQAADQLKQDYNDSKLNVFFHQLCTYTELVTDLGNNVLLK